MRNTSLPTGRGADSADLRFKEARRHVRHHDERRQSVEVRHAAADRKAGDLGSRPLDRKRDRRVAQHAEVVGLVRVLPDVFAVKDKVLPKGLLETSVKLIAPTRTQRGSGHAGTDRRRHDRVDHRIVASHARQDQVLVERRFERAGVGNAQHGIGGLDIVGDAQARLRLCGAGNAIVVIESESQVEGPVA